MHRFQARTGLSRKQLMVVMVGLPARGKSYISRKLARYLSWLGHATRVFNVGGYRRSILGPGQTAEFFAPENAEAQQARARVFDLALDDASVWLRGDGRVAIFDATNTTKARRRAIVERMRAENRDVLFVESIARDADVVEGNVRAKVESPDYTGVDPVEALRDFRMRLAHYERQYEPLDSSTDEDLSFVQLIDLGRQVRAHRIDGYLPARIVFFLLNANLTPRALFLTRHGQSVFNVRHRIGGDSQLTMRGETYARLLGAWCAEREPRYGPMVVWTSTLQRAGQTASYLPWPAVRWRALDEIDAGDCDGMTYDEIGRSMPEVAQGRSRDKLGYRYPRGESYQDLIERLEPVIIELERQRTAVIVVSHQAVLRVLYGYFMEHPPEVCPQLEIPLHTVIELTLRVTGSDERRHVLGPAIEDPAPSGD